MSWHRYGFTPYVPVEKRLAKGQKDALALAKKEKRTAQPVKPEGRQIAKNFWGKAWCEHLRSMSDIENRLDRGKRYLTNGSVVDLVITPCKVDSLVAGSSTYKVSIKVQNLPASVWEQIKKTARNSVRSVVDLLAGKLDESVIRILTDPVNGIFPKSSELVFSCSCPDGAYVCKHVAAVFYGVGTLLDSQPELLFLIRNVDSSELVGLGAVASSLEETLATKSSLGNSDLEEMFGIELEKESFSGVPGRLETATPNGLTSVSAGENSERAKTSLKKPKTAKSDLPVKVAQAPKPVKDTQVKTGPKKQTGAKASQSPGKAPARAKVDAKVQAKVKPGPQKQLSKKPDSQPKKPMKKSAKSKEN